MYLDFGQQLSPLEISIGQVKKKSAKLPKKRPEKSRPQKRTYDSLAIRWNLMSYGYVTFQPYQSLCIKFYFTTTIIKQIVTIF